jgi:hypothetical protein
MSEKPKRGPVPNNMDLCRVLLKHGDGAPHFAVWVTHYSLYGAGGHFEFGSGGMAGIPVDVESWSKVGTVNTEEQPS